MLGLDVSGPKDEDSNPVENQEGDLEEQLPTNETYNAPNSMQNQNFHGLVEFRKAKPPSFQGVYNPDVADE